MQCTKANCPAYPYFPLFRHYIGTVESTSTVYVDYHSFSIIYKVSYTNHLVISVFWLRLGATYPGNTTYCSKPSSATNSYHYVCKNVAPLSCKMPTAEIMHYVIELSGLHIAPPLWIFVVLLDRREGYDVPLSPLTGRYQTATERQLQGETKQFLYSERAKLFTPGSRTNNTRTHIHIHAVTIAPWHGSHRLEQY